MLSVSKNAKCLLLYIVVKQIVYIRPSNFWKSIFRDAFQAVCGQRVHLDLAATSTYFHSTSSCILNLAKFLICFYYYTFLDFCFWFHFFLPFLLPNSLIYSTDDFSPNFKSNIDFDFLRFFYKKLSLRGSYTFILRIKPF